MPHTIAGVVAFITKSVLGELRDLYPEEVSENINSLQEALSLVHVAAKKKFVVILYAGFTEGEVKNLCEKYGKAPDVAFLTSSRAFFSE